jgi:hypothetical protein
MGDIRRFEIADLNVQESSRACWIFAHPSSRDRRSDEGFKLIGIGGSNKLRREPINEGVARVQGGFNAPIPRSVPEPMRLTPEPLGVGSPASLAVTTITISLSVMVPSGKGSVLALDHSPSARRLP